MDTRTAWVIPCINNGSDTALRAVFVKGVVVILCGGHSKVCNEIYVLLQQKVASQTSFPSPLSAALAERR